MRVSLLVCACLVLLCLVSLASGTTQQHKAYPETLIYNFVLNSTCQMSNEDMYKQMLNTTCLQLAATEWSATHDIAYWKSTSFAHTDTTKPEIWKYAQQYNIPHTALNAHVQYESAVHLPGVLSVFMPVEIKLAISKYVYVTQDNNPTMHTVTLIAGIPVVQECVLYSRVSASAHNAMLSRNTAAFPAIAWYLNIFRAHIEQSLRDSLWRNTWALTRAWCGELHA